MPEWPEVEAVARSLRPLVRDQHIVGCRVRHGIVVRPLRPAQFRQALEGQRIEDTERRGKYLLMHLTRGCLVLHFRLDGQLIWADSPARSGARAPAFGASHVDVELELDTGTLGFVDRRHFGRMQWLARPEDSPGICSLGRDPASPGFTARYFEELLSRSRRPVKAFLTDQTRIAGLGNIYSNEVLWHARLDPRRPTHRIEARNARRLHKSIVYVLRRALECCVHPPPDFRDPGWWFQDLGRILRVYDREGKCCRRCGGIIRRIEQGGKSSYFCPGCQR